MILIRSFASSEVPPRPPFYLSVDEVALLSRLAASLHALGHSTDEWGARRAERAIYTKREGDSGRRRVAGISS